MSEASMTVGMPCSRQSAHTSSMLASDTGCPPMRLVPASMRTYAMASGPLSAMSVRRASTSMSPLNGRSLVTSSPSGLMSSSTSPPLATTCALEVVKW